MAKASTRSAVLGDFAGGLNLRRDQLALAENEFPYALNLVPDRRGGLKARPDWKFVGPAGSRQSTRPAVTADFVSLTGGNQVVVGTALPYSWATSGVAMTPELIYYYPVTGASDEPVLTQNSMGITSSRQVGGVGVAAFDGNAYLARGVGQDGYKWSGTLATALTASSAGQWQDSFATPTGTHMPRAEHVCTHAGHLWVAYTSEDGFSKPNRLRYSHPLFPESWREEDYIDLPEGGGSIKGLISLGDTLYVLKDMAIYQILGYDFESWQVVKASEVEGCQSQRHACAGMDAMYFVSWPGGIYRMAPGERPTKISEALDPLFTTTHVNVYALAWSALTFNGGRLHWNVSVSNGSTLEPTVSSPFGVFSPATINSGHPSAKFTWDPETGAWWAEAGGPSAPFSTTGGGLLGMVDVASSTQASKRTVGQSFQLGYRPWVRVDGTTFTGDDILTGIGPETTATQPAQRVLRTRWMDAGSTAWKKRFVRPEVICREQSGTFDFIWGSYRDWNEASPVRSGTLSLSGSNATGTVIGRLPQLGTSRSAQLLLYFPTTGESALLQVDFRFVPRNR